MATKAEYGKGHAAFLEYVEMIVYHPNYVGMPDLRGVDDTVQWEAPSNRTGGHFKDSHHKRRDWWRKKAVACGIEETGHWISKTAKTIHPTKKKPCKKCGKVMDIRYSYPTASFIGRIKRLSYVDDSFPLDPVEHILELVARMVEQLGNRVFTDLPKLLKSGGIVVPSMPARLDVWLKWIDETYIPAEPRGVLSPGAMSNAPDRLDGFHSFNLCCRGTADPGRSKENLQSYATDRRVFEYWVDGDWVAADHLMGAIRSRAELKALPCGCGQPGPCSADHIGPISLGFAHRPEFKLLCHSCNSAKNNRMTQADVAHLIRVETVGEPIASWYCKELWDLCKGLVTSDETALRLSKLMRDNRHTVMYVLDSLAKTGHLTFLCSYLGLGFADEEPAFTNLRVADQTTAFDRLTKTARTTKYAVEQKARRLRVAFSALDEYVGKENRNAYVISNPQTVGYVNDALTALNKAAAETGALDREIAGTLAMGVPPEETLREIVTRIPSGKDEPTEFATARLALGSATGVVAKHLRTMWTNERYVREAVGEV